MAKPIAVLLSDVHYSLQTLEVADAATRLAIGKANALQVPLIVCGDLHDTKANMRGEVVSRMIETFDRLPAQPVYILRGNHDQINEKSQEHSLDFLSLIPHVTVVDSSTIEYFCNTEVNFIPYQHDSEVFKNKLLLCSKKSLIIAHQGIVGSDAGEYIQDKSAITPQDVAGRRIISGHYHRRQTIALPDGGQWDYVGNPYTLSWGEANDPQKGFQVLMDDGSLEFVPTNLRKHVKIEINPYDLPSDPYIAPGDLVWVKVTYIGKPPTKEQIAEGQMLTQDFRLDLIPLETETEAPTQVHNLSDHEILNSLTDSLSNTDEDTKQRVKTMLSTLALKD